jgi:hypothetical protein
MLELAALKPVKGGNTMRRLDLARRKPTAQGPSMPQHMSFAVRNLRPGEKLAGIEGLDEDPSMNGSAIKGSFGPLNGIDE